MKESPIRRDARTYLTEDTIVRFCNAELAVLEFGTYEDKFVVYINPTALLILKRLVDHFEAPIHDPFTAATK